MKQRSVIKYSIAAGLLAAAGFASASPYCTDAARAEWQDSIAFQQKLRDQGLAIDNFEITRGGCYKVEGWDKEKRRVKQYYNAQTGELVRSRMDRDWGDDRYSDRYDDGRQGNMRRWHDDMMGRGDGMMGRGDDMMGRGGDMMGRGDGMKGRGDDMKGRGDAR